MFIKRSTYVNKYLEVMYALYTLQFHDSEFWRDVKYTMYALLRKLKVRLNVKNLKIAFIVEIFVKYNLLRFVRLSITNSL